MKLSINFFRKKKELKKELKFKQLIILYNELNFYKKEYNKLLKIIEDNKYKINDI